MGTLQDAISELEEAVQNIRQERTNAMLALDQKAIEAEKVRDEAREATRLLEEERKKALEWAVKLKTAEDSVTFATKLRRDFVFQVIGELAKHGMVVQSFEDGLKTNEFMAFSGDDGKLTLGGPKTDGDDMLLAKHRDQLNLLLETISGWETKRRKISEFKIIPAERYGNLLFDQSLTIWWP